MGRANTLFPEFEKRNVKMIAISTDTVEDHHAWIKDITGDDSANSPAAAVRESEIVFL